MRIVPFALATAAALVGATVVAAPASARTIVSFGIGAPAYPVYYAPAYYPGYYGPAYYPAYAPYYGGTIIAGGWYGHHYGVWHRGYYGRGWHGRGHGWHR